MKAQDRWQAIQQFWESFGLNAYDENSVPEDAQMPYITYRAVAGSFEQAISMSASVWYRSTAWAGVSQKSDEISRAIGEEPVRAFGDHEYMHVARGVPFAQRMPDTDDTVKRIYINVMAEFFTHI